MAKKNRRNERFASADGSQPPIAVSRAWSWRLAGIAGFVLMALSFPLWEHFSTTSSVNGLTVWQTHLSHESNGKLDRQADLVSQTTFDDSSSEYIGAASCKECHPDQYASYRTTTHSRAFKATDADNEPVGGRFVHEPSNRIYEAVVRDGRLVHRETIVGENQRPLSQIDRVIDFTVGSGTHAHTYLFEDDGFLVESPITWYAGGAGWGMSPGYDKASQAAFTRQVKADCLFCHVGMVQTAAENVSKLEIVEHQIGCERCHGPGRGHVNFFSNSANVNSEERSSDDQIVHPGKLSDSALEAICQQCHLQGFAMVTAPGQTVWDFRPGQSLELNRTDFQYQGNTESRIVGHVEQMHESECYTQSGSMTCITCHDPHHQHPTTDRVDFYRSICLSCHSNVDNTAVQNLQITQQDDCGLALSVRHAEADNDCAQCHMPKRPTNVSHAALHDHRIRVPGSQEKPRAEELLVEPIVKPRNLPAEEIQRRQAIAVQGAVYSKGESAVSSNQMSDSVRTMLERLKSETPDPNVDVTMAIYASNSGNFSYAKQLAKRALKFTHPGETIRSDALIVLAGAYFREGNNDEAMGHYQELTMERRDASDHVMLSLCLRNAGRADEAIVSLERALRIDPGFRMAHEEMFAQLRESDPKRAEMHLNVVKAFPSQSD